MDLSNLSQSLDDIAADTMAVPEHILRLMVDRHMASQNTHFKLLVQEAIIERTMEAATEHLNKLNADMAAMKENLRIVAENMAELRTIAAEREWKQQAFLKQAETRKRRLAGMHRRNNHTGNVNFTNWKAKCKSAFEDKSNLKSLPMPSLPRCSRYFCGAYATTVACRHNVEQFLRGSGQYSARFLKNEVTLWHPDRFSMCSPETIELVHAEAIPFYRILHDLYVYAKEQGEG